MIYMLDTNTVSFALRGVGHVAERILEQAPESICISAVTESELWFGVAKRRSKRLARLVETFLQPITVVAYGSEAARAYGDVRALLERRGESIGIADSMIAAHALSADCVLVTNNTRHFARIRRLRLADWRG